MNTIINIPVEKPERPVRVQMINLRGDTTVKEISAMKGRPIKLYFGNQLVGEGRVLRTLVFRDHVMIDYEVDRIDGLVAVIQDPEEG